jgi:hypothetical protein
MSVASCNIDSVQDKGRDILVLTATDPLLSCPFPMTSVVDDTGAFVHSLLQVPPGKKVIGVNEWLSMREMIQLIADAMGKKVEVIDQDLSIDLGDPELSLDMAEMAAACIEFGFDGGKVDKSVLQPKDLGVPVPLKTLKDWARKQDWHKALKVV